MYFPEREGSRLAKATSCLVKHSWYAVGEEMTTARREPNQRETTLPYCFDMRWKKRWIGCSRRLRFPIMGRGGGPGGMFLNFLLWKTNFTPRNRTRKRTAYETTTNNSPMLAQLILAPETMLSVSVFDT